MTDGQSPGDDSNATKSEVIRGRALADERGEVVYACLVCETTVRLDDYGKEIVRECPECGTRGYHERC